MSTGRRGRLPAEGAYALLTAALLAVSAANGLTFLTAGAVCAAVAAAARFLLPPCGAEEAQRKRCAPCGALLLLPSSALIALSAGVGRLKERPVPARTYLLLSVIAGGLVLSAAWSLAAGWKRRTDGDRISRFADVAALAVSAALAADAVGRLAAPEDAVRITRISGIACGAAGLLAALGLLALRRGGAGAVLRSVSGLLRGGRLTITRASAVKDACLVLGKMVLAAVSGSLFMLVNALYSAGMGVARGAAVRMFSQDEERQLRQYRLIGAVILFSSVCYAIYLARLFFGGHTPRYPMTVALIIACYTFFEFGVNVREAVRVRKSRALGAKALRAIQMSSNLMCFVLTQTAILSFASEDDNRFYNAISGVLFGLAAALIGLFVVIGGVRCGRRDRTGGAE